MSSAYVTKVTCDNCGQEKLSPEGWLSLVMSITWNSPQFAIDLCDRCVATPIRVLVNRISEKGNPDAHA